MPIPGPGVPITMTTIATEFGGTVPHSLSEYYRGGGLVPNTPSNATIPTSGTIAMSNFYGTANRNAVSLTIAANTSNYNVYDNRGPAYIAGATDLTVTVNPGVVVSGGSPGLYAMLVPSAFNPGDTVTIINNGTLIGSGSNAGPGGSGSAGGTPGNTGGNALFVDRPTTVTNNSLIAGGGGGGGGGGSVTAPKARRLGGGGGGGGAGSAAGAGGAGGTGSGGGNPGLPGAPGTLTAGGGGGGSPSPIGRPGGPGGGQGADGAPGTPGGAGAGTGGAAGFYIVGNPFVTYPATGTRLGRVG
jgi:hypothetical protein